ncbi:MAG: T9SS type A sorting domain-containing protein [Bacteroidota bacterium]
MNRFALLLLLVALPASAQDWTAIPLGTSGTLRAIENTSFSQKYVVGDGGFVAQSNPDRTVWTPVSVGTSADLHSVIQPAFNQTWVGGAAGAVRVSDNVGNWFVRDIPSGETFYLFTRSSTQALAAGSGGSIWKSENLGEDWTLNYTGSVPLRAGVGGTFGDGWVVGDAGTILKGSDGGAVWTPVASGTTRDLHAVRFGSGVSVIAVGEAGTILTSTDGAVWTPRLSGTAHTLRDVSRSKQNADFLLAVGDDGVALKSTDGGVLWCRLTTGVPTDLHAAEMASNAEYVVAGDDGLLLRTTTSGGDCVPGIDATLERVGSGSIPPDGGTIQYTVALTNPSPETQTFQAWVDAVLPNGNTLGPLQGPVPLTFAPGQSVGPISFTEQVPAGAPFGVYRLRLRVGDFSTGALLDESTVTYTNFNARVTGDTSLDDWQTLEGSLTETAADGASVEATVSQARASEAAVLEAVYPNPVGGQGSLRFSLLEAGPVRLAVYDVLGREVAWLAEGWREAGTHTASFDAGTLPSGTYVVRLSAAGQVHTQRVTVAR